MQPPSLQPTLPQGLPDDWVLDRDVACPDCGYNLRMRREPRCPECGAVHRWQTLLLIACPRCGESLGTTDAAECPHCRVELNWRALLDSARPEQRAMFEHADAPLRAAARLFLAVLHPKRFWAGIPLETPVNTRRLRALLIAVLLLLAVAAAASALTIAQPSGRTVYAEDFIFMMGAAVGAAIALPLGTILVLMIFSTTLARHRIRSVQLQRCTASSAAALGWLACWLLLVAAVDMGASVAAPNSALANASAATLLGLLAPFGVLLALCLGQPTGIANVPLGLVATAAVGGVGAYFGIILWLRMLYCGLRNYLRLGLANTLAMLISTQVITALAYFTALVTLALIAGC